MIDENIQNQQCNHKIRQQNKHRQQMGNETVTKTKRPKNKNSYSVDFGHELPGKIKPSNNTLKLIPLSDSKSKDRSQIFQPIDNNNENSNQEQSNQNGVQEQGIQTRRANQQLRKQSSARLKKLNTHNDQLRKQLIRISSQLTEKLKKKKFQVKKVQQVQANPNRKQSLKKELENAYKQIDMYKKLLYDLKIGESSGAKLLDVEDKISAVDLQIQKTIVQIQAIKNVTTNQSAGIRRDKGWEALQELKSEVQALKLSIKQKSKQQRLKQKVYMKQHHYMKCLQEKLNKINEEDEQQYKNSKVEEDKPTEKQIKSLQQQVEWLKIKHDEYHKKINSYITSNKVLKQQKKQLKVKLDESYKIVEGLKYKRDAFVKQIKDNLHLFATTNHRKQEELSQFQSDQEEMPDPIQQQEDERGTFDVQHLKDHQLKKLNKQQILKQKQEKALINEQQEPRAEPKHWKKQLTRIISKGKQQGDQKKFEAGLTVTPKSSIKIVQMNIWMNKKKQITAIQPSYMVDGRIFQGAKSSKNLEDEYKVTYELEEHDYLKSILGIFSKNGFLQYLVLQSNFGKISKIGREQTDGDNFAVGVAKEETPVLITGANRQDGLYWRISRLDFEVLFQINS